MSPRQERLLDRNGLEVLEGFECRELLRTAQIGRVGVTVGALPAIFPVHFRLGDRGIVFRTAPGSKLDAALHGHVVAFEADGHETFSHTGWSVLVQGVATVVEDPAEIERCRELHLPRWLPTAGEDYVCVSLDLLSGRRICTPGT